jgi:hypothetical protein
MLSSIANQPGDGGLCNPGPSRGKRECNDGSESLIGNDSAGEG